MADRLVFGTCRQKQGFSDKLDKAKVSSVPTDDVTELVSEDVGELGIVFHQSKIVRTHPDVVRPRDHEAKQHRQ